MADTSIDGKVQRLQTMLYMKATSEPQTRFTNLYTYLSRPEWIEMAVTHVLRNQGSRTPGIDGVTRTTLRDVGYRDKLVSELCLELKAATYVPQPTRRVFIPKANGKRRPLGIPTLKDRIVQQLVKMIIEPLCEARFLPNSYGFRPNRCTWDALADVYFHLKGPCRYYTVIEGDIENCFGTIDHSRLMRELQRFIGDPRLLALLWKMLRAGVMDNLMVFETTEGTPQGGIVSPLLANVYLHRLDEWFATRFPKEPSPQRRKKAARGELAHVRYIRYADDFVVLLRGTEEQAATLKEEMTVFLRHELKMTLSEQKTLITHATKGFDFLGVNTKVSPYRSNPNRLLPFQVPSTTSIERYRQKVREITGSHKDYVPAAERIRALNWLIEGWAHYHHWGNAKSCYLTLGFWTTCRVMRMLRRATPEGLHAARRKYLRPLAECANLRQWRRHTKWKTPSVEIDEGMKMGLVPMGAISAKDYWQYRGNSIPAAFGLPTTQPTAKHRETTFYTADEVVVSGAVVTRTHQSYTQLYFVRRQDVFRRDHYTCTDCGYHSQRQRGEVHDLECHHIIPNGDHSLTNLRTVCIGCHQRLTREQDCPS